MPVVVTASGQTWTIAPYFNPPSKDRPCKILVTHMKKRDYDRIVKEEVAIPVCKRREMIEERYLRELLPPGRDSARRHSGK